ncbi:MAG: hypothetical protein V3U82_07700 [Robiginitomaculum sp.]
MQWFAQVQGQVYGPYENGQMQSFVSEGRITTGSLISNNPATGFFQAVGYDIFTLWSGTGQMSAAQGSALGSIQGGGGPIAAQTSAPTPSPSNVTAFRQPEGKETDKALHQFIIMAEIHSDNSLLFLRALQTFGTAERVGDSVWVLKSGQTTQVLRNGLSQTLTRQDRLFIVDSAANKTAWFNIGADLDNRIRNLWSRET